MSDSHWVTMTTNGANSNITISTVPPNTLYDQLRQSAVSIQTAKEQLETDDYTPEVRDRAKAIWAAAPAPEEVIVHRRTVGSPAWLID